MKLTTDEVDLIRDTFRAVASESAPAAERFYRRLFEIAPATRHLFIGDLTQQGIMLMSTLGVVVAQLQRWEMLSPVVEDLALRHVGYGVVPEHYGQVGAALIDMMSETLDDRFTPDARAAWDKAYAALAGHMIAVAYARRHPLSGAVGP